MDAAAMETLRDLEVAEMLERPLRLSNTALRRRLERQRLIRSDEWTPPHGADEPLPRDRRRWFLTQSGRQKLMELRARPATWRTGNRRPEFALPPSLTTEGFDPAVLPPQRKDMLTWCWLLILTASLYANDGQPAGALAHR